MRTKTWLICVALAVAGVGWASGPVEGERIVREQPILVQTASITVHSDTSPIVGLRGTTCMYFRGASRAGEAELLPSRSGAPTATLFHPLMEAQMGSPVSPGIWLSPRSWRTGRRLTVSLSTESHGWTMDLDVLKGQGEHAPRVHEAWRMFGLFSECNFGLAEVWSERVDPAFVSRSERLVVVALLVDWIAWASTDPSLVAALDTLARECLDKDCGRFLSALRSASETWRDSDAPVF